MEPLIKCEHVDLGYENQDAVIIWKSALGIICVS